VHLTLLKLYLKICKLGLDTGSLLTSLTKGADDSMSWLGGIAADFLNFNPKEPPKKEDGNCAGLGLDFLLAVPCEKPSKFMCEAKKPEKCGIKYIYK